MENVAEKSSLSVTTSGVESLDPEHGRATLRAVAAILCYQGYALTLLSVAAPFIARSFALDESGIAKMYAWISLNALGALLLSRMADRLGRRRIMLLSLIATPLSSLGAALATQAGWFIGCEIVAYAGIGAALTSSFVMMAEALPISERSRGQGIANLTQGLGGGLCVILAPLLAYLDLSWRWLFALPGAAVILVPMMIRALPESQRWERAASAGIAERSRFYDIFGPRYRGRAVPLIVATLIGEVSGVAVGTWIYYHAVTVVGLSPAKGAAILLIGGTVGNAGVALGVWMAERIGRVRTVVTLGFAGIGGVLGFYWGPPTGFAWPTLWLIVANSWFTTTGRGLVVAANSAITELFPTALRGAIMGWILFTVTFSAIGAQAAIAVLAGPMGGLSNVVGWLALLTIPCMLIWWFFIDETRGLSLEAASGGE